MQAGSDTISHTEAISILNRYFREMSATREEVLEAFETDDDINGTIEEVVYWQCSEVADEIEIEEISFALYHAAFDVMETYH